MSDKKRILRGLKFSDEEWEIIRETAAQYGMSARAFLASLAKGAVKRKEEDMVNRSLKTEDRPENYDATVRKIALEAALKGLDIEKTLTAISEVLIPAIDIVLDLAAKNEQYILKCLGNEELTRAK